MATAAPHFPAAPTPWSGRRAPTIEADEPEQRPFVHRICTATGLKVDLAAQRLIMANAVAAVVFLLTGGVYALLLALTRWQAIHLLPAQWFYRVLTAHGFDMLVAWIVFFEMAGLYFGGTVLLNARLVAPKLGWLQFGLMLAGGVLLNTVVLMGEADVAYTAYVPLKASPLFYLSYILFAVGALIGVLLFISTWIVARHEKRYEGSVPLVVYGLLTAAGLALYTLIQGTMAFLPAFLWSLGIMETLDPGYYRNTFWGFGHPAQQVNLAAMVAVWYLLAAITTGAKPLNEKLSRTAFVLYFLFINFGSVHHLLVDPGYSFLYKVVNTSYGMYLAVLGSLIHAFSIPAAFEVALRKKGYNGGLFQWLRKAPWKEPGFAALALSLIGFGWVGGITGVTIGTEQLNMVIHNTLRVPGHFHATVAWGTTLAFMGLTYYVIPLIFRRELKLVRWAQLQPYVFSLGMLLIAAGLIATGIQGAPRRHWDISFSGAGFPVDIPNTVHLTLAVFGVGALIAVVGAGMYLSVVLASVFLGRRIEPTSAVLVSSSGAGPIGEVVLAPAGNSGHGGARAHLTEEEEERLFEPKGTFVIVLIFLGFFATYYLANWWLLGRGWGVS
ncbi:MAG TPA: cbb3-type cytochrome c oxidase subunit I [Chloroflexota bacterium]|nr:cbb3-type cytochrome c oxidase subunit I [Chloroflexota bacterium]